VTWEASTTGIWAAPTLGWVGAEGGHSDPTPSIPSFCCEEEALGTLFVEDGGGVDLGDAKVRDALLNINSITFCTRAQLKY
jgi:hypothetical protein